MSMTKTIPKDYVKIAKCRMCGGKTGTILLHKQLKSIKEENTWDADPCEECKERLKTMVYFIGNCGHSGFVKDTVIKDRITPGTLLEAVLKRRVCRMEKCLVCISGQDIKDFEHI